MGFGLLRFKLRVRLFVSFVAVLILLAGATALGGMHQIEEIIVAEGQKRIGSYLKAAWSVYNSKLVSIGQTVKLLANNPTMLDGFAPPRQDAAADDRQAQGVLKQDFDAALEDLRVQWKLDFLALADIHGRVRARGRFPYAKDDYLRPCCATGSGRDDDYCAFTTIFSAERLVQEGRGLAEKAFTQVKETPRAKERPGTAETSGLVMKACAVIPGTDGKPAGWLYGGVLVNGSTDIVDSIKQMVFGSEQAGGRDVGTVTIFQWDLRVATNVRDRDGNRAIGTRVSSEVYDAVLVRGESWLDEAFVVSDWYLSAYEPIKDRDGQTIGMLYVGELLAKYEQMRSGMLWRLLLLTALGVLVVLVLSYFVARRLTRPLTRLTEAARKVTSGDFSIKLPMVTSTDEIGELTTTFDRMVREVDDRGRKLEEAFDREKAANEELAKTNRDYLDILGFVSHEMRSPLAAAVMAIGALESGGKDKLSDMEKLILRKIKNNVQHSIDMSTNYLNLSRIERKELAYHPENLSLHSLVVPVIANFADEMNARKMEAVMAIPVDRIAYVDRNLMAIVYTNLLSNAIKYGREGGRIQLGCERDRDTYRLNVYNEGTGISSEDKVALFKRFSRLDSTVRSGTKGTGLGLFIARAAVRMQGGTIWVEGEKDAYANFIFTVPAAIPSAPDR